MVLAGGPIVQIDESMMRSGEALKETHWMVHGKKGAAEILGINPSTLRSRMEKLGIKKTQAA